MNIHSLEPNQQTSDKARIDRIYDNALQDADH